MTLYRWRTIRGLALVTIAVFASLPAITGRAADPFDARAALEKQYGKMLEFRVTDEDPIVSRCLNGWCRRIRMPKGGNATVLGDLADLYFYFYRDEKDPKEAFFTAAPFRQRVRAVVDKYGRKCKASRDHPADIQFCVLRSVAEKYGLEFIHERQTEAAPKNSDKLYHHGTTNRWYRIEYCIDHYCDRFEISVDADRIALNDFAFLYFLAVPRYDGTEKKLDRPTIQKMKGLRAELLERYGDGCEKNQIDLHCVLKNLKEKHAIQVRSVKYDEGHTNMALLDDKEFAKILKEDGQK